MTGNRETMDPTNYSIRPRDSKHHLRLEPDFAPCRFRGKLHHLELNSDPAWRRFSVLDSSRPAGSPGRRDRQICDCAHMIQPAPHSSLVSRLALSLQLTW